MSKRNIVVDPDTLRLLGWEQTGILMMMDEEQQKQYWEADRRRREYDAYAQNLSLGLYDPSYKAEDCGETPCQEPSRSAFSPRYARSVYPRGRGIE